MIDEMLLQILGQKGPVLEMESGVSNSHHYMDHDGVVDFLTLVGSLVCSHAEEYMI